MRFKKLTACFLSVLILSLFLSSLVQPVLAQTTTVNTPNTDADVPQNQHYFAQSVIIEVMSAVICQLAGIDPVNPKSPCLGIDPVTKKLGFANTDNQNTAPHIGGILGASSNMIAFFYTPTISTRAYINYLSDNFGIVKKADAAPAAAADQNGYGLTSLQPLLKLWTDSRDIAYFIFVVAFMLIGLGIMLRVKIDPRTVMTIQNQIPRIIICILLITFSYAIAALMIDIMWIVTYIGINELTTISGATANQGTALATTATTSLLYTPMGFADKIFTNGLFGLTYDISTAMGDVVTRLVTQALGGNNLNCSFTNFSIQGCLGATLGFLTDLVMVLVILITLVMTLFRLWFELLKAYTYTLIYVFAAPLWIVMGLLPGKPLGFEKWLRSLFVNLATFPAVALMILLARIFLDVFNTNVNPQNTFIPPLVGDPNMHDFGALIAFGVLLMTPTILTMLRESLKVPGTKHGSAIASGMAAGFAVPGAIGNRAVANATKRSQTGEALGPLARLSDAAGNRVANVVGKIPGFKSVASRSNFQKEHGHTFRDYKPDYQERQAYGQTLKEGQSFDEKGYGEWKRNKGYEVHQMEQKKSKLEGRGKDKAATNVHGQITRIKEHPKHSSYWQSRQQNNQQNNQPNGNQGNGGQTSV